MAKTHRAPNSTIHCTGSTKNDRKTWQNRTRNLEDGFESCSVHHKKFRNQTILELFLLLFALKSSWFTIGKMQLQCDLAGGVPALAARVLNMQIRCRFETSSVFFVYCGAGNIHQGDTISNHSSLRDSYKSSPTGGT